MRADCPASPASHFLTAYRIFPLHRADARLTVRQAVNAVQLPSGAASASREEPEKNLL